MSLALLPETEAVPSQKEEEGAVPTPADLPRVVRVEPSVLGEAGSREKPP